MNRPQISIIIPIYNTEKYLKQCLDSLIEQTFKDIEIICVNDGSTDNSKNILEKFAAEDNRFVILNQENQGASRARNKAINLAKGDYILFLDSDDFFAPQMLEKSYNKALASDADITIFQFQSFDNKTNSFGSVSGINIENIPEEALFTHKDCPKIFPTFYAVVWNKLYKTQFIKENKLEFQEIPCSEDISFCFESLALASKILVLKEVFVFYRTNLQGNLSSYTEKCSFYGIEAFIDLRNKLIKHGLLEELEKPLKILSTALFCTFLNNLQDEEIQKEYKKYYNKALFKKDGLIKIIIRKSKNRIKKMFNHK